MTITPKRWAVACVLGCLVLAVLFLPPQPNDDPYWAWTPRWSNKEQGVQTRMQARRLHGGFLWQAYRSARDVDVAKREFGGKSGLAAAAKGPAIWFDTDVPGPVRRDVNRLIDAEESARGSWRDRGGIGVLVFTDTATRVDGARLPWGYNAGLNVSTTILRPTRETGGRCVAVIRIGHLVLSGASAMPSDHPLLDGCAYYDAFGAPGPQIEAWMDSTNGGFARVLSFAPLDSAAIQAMHWRFFDFWYSSATFTRCAGNDLASCAALLRTPSVNKYWSYWRDNSVPAPVEALEIPQRATGFGATLLDEMVREIGPERFQRVWTSPKSLDSAYFDATGEQASAWVHARAVATTGGGYRIGPLPTLTSAILTLVTIACVLALSVRFARRPLSI